MYFVYIVRCSDETRYIGHTKDPETREKEHNKGYRARYAAM